ncbi:MAG: PspC domain-containing protein [Acidimicrobiia bacterium]|nr:PspC domain-containing protein [Acidimicrobiia bacterium]MDH5616545.1 PspC domain-containing protein [Acidimicrobiia bacterium]
MSDSGSCGIAAQYGWKSDTVRLVYVLVSLFSAGFPGLVVYVVLWALVPEED